MIKMLKTVRGAYDPLGLEQATYKKDETYSSETTPPTSEALEVTFVNGGLAEYVEPKPEVVSKPDAPEKTKPDSPKVTKTRKKRD